MVNIKVELKQGLKVGEVVHKDVEVRSMTAGDSILANERAEKAYYMPDGSIQVAASPNLVGKYLLLRRIVKLGSLQPPLSEKELEALPYADYEYLISEIQKADKAEAKAFNDKDDEQGRSLESWGRDD